MDSIKNINNILGDFFNNHDKEKVYQAFLKVRWNEIMPYAIKIRTKNIFLSDQSLIIKLDSSPLKQELQILEGKILKKINEKKFPVNLRSINKLIFQ